MPCSSPRVSAVRLSIIGGELSLDEVGGAAVLLDDAAYRALHRKGVAGTWVEAGRLVRRWRLDQGLTQRELAERVDTTVGEVRRVEAGTARPQMVTLRRWLGVTGIAVGRWYPELA